MKNAATSSSKRTWRRLLGWALVGALALVALALAVVTIALDRPGVQQMVLEGISESVETELGFKVEADGFDLGLVRGRLEVRGLRLRVGSGEPFARIRNARLRFLPSSLIRGPIRLRVLEFDQPEVDLGAPLPAAAESDPSAPPLESIALVIDRLLVSEARVVGAAPADAQAILERWSLEDLELEGAFDGSRLTISSLVAKARIDRGEAGPIDLELEVAAGFELAGAIDVETLNVLGDGLSLESSLRVADQPELSSGSIRLAADLGLLRGAEATGKVTLDGDIDLANWSGTIRLRAPAQDASVLADLGLVEGGLAQDLELAGTKVDLQIDLGLARDPSGARAVNGELGAQVSRAKRSLLELEASPRATLRDGALADAANGLAVETTVDARLLPDEAGVRTVSARLSSADGRDLESWLIDRGRSVVEQPSVDRLLQVGADLWPSLLAASALRDLPRLGALSATAEFDGALGNPRIEASARLSPGEQGRVDVAAKGRPLANDWRVELAGAGLELADYTGAASGRVDFAGSVEDPLGAPAGSFEASVRDLATESEAVFSELGVGLEGTARELAWTLDGVPAGGGKVSGLGTVRPESPLRSGVGNLVWETGDVRVPKLETSFELVKGTLSADVVATAGGRAPIEARLVLPLGALEDLPGIGDLSAVPVERRAGLALLTWRVPDEDWRDLLPEDWALRFGRLRGGSTGTAAVDLSCIPCAEVVAELSGLELELDGRRMQSAKSLTLRAEDGVAQIEPWAVAGEGLRFDLSALANLSKGWRAGEPIEELFSDTRGALSASVDSAWLGSLPIAVLEPGTIEIEAEISGPLRELVGSGRLSAPALTASLEAYPDLAVAGLEAGFRLDGGFLEWQDARVEVGEAKLRTTGRARLASPLGEAAGTLEVSTGLPVLTGSFLPFEVADGRLAISGGRLETAGGEGSLEIELPLAAGADAVVGARWSLPVNDWAPLLARLGAAEDPQVLEAAVAGRLTLPLERPAAAEVEMRLTDARIVVRGRESVIEPAVELTVAGGRASIVPFRLSAPDQSFDFQARADLKSDWSLGDDPAELITFFEVLGNGDVDFGLLNPFLVGGRAEGSLGLDVELAGTPSAFAGRIEAKGPGASILYRSPYLARFEDPSFEISIRDARVTLERGALGLNEGLLEVSGILSGEDGTNLGLKIKNSVFRLDYGLLVTLGGDLRFATVSDGSSLVSGALDVERGTLTRNVQLDLDLLSQLLAPIDLTTTEDDPLDLVALDLEVRTREGVRVKNNLGDLLVRWEPLEVTGTLARPIIEGRLEVDPGGLLFAYGQTVRLDKAVIEYPGEEGVEPRLDFEATTSLEDPTIGQLSGADPFAAVSRNPAPASATPAGEAVTAELARFYGEQFAGKLGESVGVSVSLRPLLIFGETDPGARLTVSRDLSANFALAASIDLRGAEDRTYLLELHELRTLPRLVAQAFTDDGSGFGGALLQRQEWGGSRKTTAGELPRISKIESNPPRGVSKRGIKRALGLEKGDLLDPDQRFIAEVELVDYLMRKGYPDARVSVRTVPDERRELRVRLEVAIEPGPRVEFVFEGEKIAKPLRPLITSLYRPDFFEPESIEEMRAETVRALRSRGFLEPEVEIEVESVDGPAAVPGRRVTVRTEGGIRISPDPPVFLGLPEEDVEVLNATFANEVQRVELAVGMPSADRRLLGTLATIGYPEARVVSRYQSLADRVLTLEIEPGPRERVAGVEVEGLSFETLPEVTEAEVGAELLVASGDPLRRSRLSRSALAIERLLGTKGYLEARVRTMLDPVDGDDYAKQVRFVVEPGEVSRLEAVEFTGLRSTREKVARRVADLETGKPLAENDLSQARTSLWRTGLFSGVGTQVVDADSGLDRVIFDLEERDRYRLTYGIRWDSEDGMGAVVDATDDNFLGRGWTLGLRALTSSEEDSLRGLARVPRAFGGPGSLELFTAVRQLTEATTDLIFGTVDVPVDVLENTLQYSHPVTERTTLRVYGRYTDTTRKEPFFTLQVKNPQLGFQYVYDSRSPEALTVRGVFASVDVSGSKEFLGGDLSYVRSFSQFSLFRPAGSLFGRPLSWSQSYRVGLADAFDQELTRSVRFFAGGEYSVRGYETESLGEQERLGSLLRPAGGAAVLIVNQELRWRLFRDYTLVVFADAGNVWDKVGELDSDLFTSTGLGVRAVTPVGLLRLDLARPLKSRLGIDPEYKIYFGIGSTF